jgi:hypothetical protein
MFGEFDGEASAGGAVEAGEEAFDDPTRRHLDTAESRYFVGIEEIEPGAVSRSGN